MASDAPQKICIMQNNKLKLNSFSYFRVKSEKKIENKKMIKETTVKMLMFKAFKEYSTPTSLPKFPNK